ncbi:MAG TPA: hypothetical protein VNW92_06280, partial [Polyangiaceae bacterium]|nr:hypothetical protein [Polyangiaceae bacterium]
SGNSVGGTNASGGGASYLPCAGKVCGASCSNCAPTDKNCVGVEMYCGPDGSCGINYRVCTGQSGQCSADTDCVTEAICQTCPDGSYACPKAYCDAGKCVSSFPGCTSECQKDNDCVAPAGPCQPCSDGSKSCPTVTCVAGKCQGSVPGCPGYDPCAGATCGSKCSPCDPAAPICHAEDIPLAYCDANGTCVPSNSTNFPDCSGGATCKTKDDCGAAPPGCLFCPGGSCATLDCIANKCAFTCPAQPPPQCKVSSDCVSDAVCKLCSDKSCATTQCLAGSCQLVCPG